MITKVKRPKVLTFRPSFTQLSRLDFGAELIKKREFEEQISFGMWNAFNGWHESEVEVRWYKWGNKLKLAYKTENEKRQRKAHPAVFELLENDMVQPEDFRVKLLQLGYADVNEFQ